MSRRRLALAAGAALLVAALTGCGKVTAETLVYDDASYDMTLYMLGEDAQIEAAGLTGTQLSDALVTELVGAPDTEDWTFTAYSADGYSGVEAVGVAVPGDNIGMFGTGLFTADDETVTFDLQYPMSLATSDFTADQTVQIQVSMTVEFPGDVIDHNGTLVDDRTVQWTGDASQDLDYSATAATSTASGDEATEETTEPSEDASDEPTASDEDSDKDADEDEGVNWLLWISVGVVVLALAGLVAWFVLRNRTPGGKGGPGAPGPQQPWGQQPQPGANPQQPWGQQPGSEPTGQPQTWGQPGAQPQQGGQPPVPPQGEQPQPPQQPWGQQPPPA